MPGGPKVFLFDIDQTLIVSGGAGMTAMTRAFERIWGIEDGFAGVAFAGRTDPAIIKEALANHGLLEENPRPAIESFRDRYLVELRGTIKEKEGRVLPGVIELLTALQGVPHCQVGVATGNFIDGARIKLSHYGLWQRFSGGAFGDDAEDRGELVGVGIERFRQAAGADLQARDFVVVGDTPNDVAAAKANGALAVAVATGFSGEEELQEAGADIVFKDLSDTAKFLRAVLWS
jgi:phosphoglycolate phosphatase-like HAD superfamily hydrolase